MLVFSDALLSYHQWTPLVDTLEAGRSCGRLCANPSLQLTFLYVLLDTGIWVQSALFKAMAFFYLLFQAFVGAPVVWAVLDFVLYNGHIALDNKAVTLGKWLGLIVNCLAKPCHKRAICGQLKLLQCSNTLGEQTVLKNKPLLVWQNDFIRALEKRQDNGMRWSNLTALE